MDHVNFSEEELATLERVRKFIAKFYLKYKHHPTLHPKSDDFEKKLVVQLKTSVMLSTRSKHWNIFMGKKIQAVFTRERQEKSFSLALEYPEYHSAKHKKQVVFFQKTGSRPPLHLVLKHNALSFLSFLLLLVLFLAFSACKEDQSVYDAVADKSWLQSVCSEKNHVISVTGTAFFSVVLYKMMTKLRNKGT